MMLNGILQASGVALHHAIRKSVTKAGAGLVVVEPVMEAETLVKAGRGFAKPIWSLVTHGRKWHDSGLNDPIAH